MACRQRFQTRLSIEMTASVRKIQVISCLLIRATTITLLLQNRKKLQ